MMALKMFVKLKNFIHAHVCILRTQLALRDSTSCVASVGFIFIIWRCGLEFRMCGLPGFIILFFFALRAVLLMSGVAGFSFVRSKLGASSVFYCVAGFSFVREKLRASSCLSAVAGLSSVRWGFGASCFLVCLRRLQFHSLEASNFIILV